MPDGDSLNWKVRGKGSRSVLALVRSGVDIRLTADEAIKMFVKQSNDGNWKILMIRIEAILLRLLPTVAKESGFSTESRIIKLIENEVASIVGVSSRGCAKWMVSAVLRCVENIASTNLKFDRREVRRELLSSVAEGLVDNRVLHPIRPDLLKELGRGKREQYDYEQDLLGEVRRRAEMLVDEFFNTPPELSVRPPNRSVPLRATDYARLAEPLTVLEVTI